MTVMRPPKGCFEDFWLPQRPLASDDLTHGIYRTSRAHALGMRHIETNPTAVFNLFSLDVDNDYAVMDTTWDNHDLMPNIMVENPINGHAHALYVLESAVARTEYAKRKPLAFATAVGEGLRRFLNADKSYHGLITHNPLHTSWDAYWFHDHRYSLTELSEALEARKCMPPKSWQRTQRKNPVGLGRNCTLFDTARTWAYREIRFHFGDSEGLAHAIRETAHEMNTTLFSEPLPTAEVDQIAKSIHRWITTKSRMWKDGPAVYEATFTTIQSARGRKGGLKSGKIRLESAKYNEVINTIEGENDI